MTYLDNYSMTAYKYLKDNSLSGELQPGDRIHILQDMERNVKVRFITLTIIQETFNFFRDSDSFTEN